MATATATTRGTVTRTVETVKKKPLPAGLPREWYESHNRRLKAMRLAISLLDSGTYDVRRATNRKIRAMAVRTGIHRPSNVTCKLVRSFIREAA